MFQTTWEVLLVLQWDMKTPPPWPDEKQRLGVLWQYAVLDMPPEKAFDTLAALAALAVPICEAPIARDIYFRSHGIHQSGLFNVPEAIRDGRFADNRKNAPGKVPGEANSRNGSRRPGARWPSAPVGSANHRGLRP
jgi:hypothetical protein